MRATYIFLSAVLVSFAALAQTPQHGVQLGDIDRNANPCTDFYQYANGAWREQNPIPASMDRWSRRWQAGENNKEQLKTILDEVSKKTDWPKGSVEQLISDHYGSCMDETRIDQLGIKPKRLSRFNQLGKAAAPQRYPFCT